MDVSLKNKYLEKHIFFGLKNINTGFDVSCIFYFSENDFRIILERVKINGLGIHGIEPWQNGEFFWAITCEQSLSDPSDHNWYMGHFKILKILAKSFNIQRHILYLATY